MSLDAAAVKVSDVFKQKIVIYLKMFSHYNKSRKFHYFEHHLQVFLGCYFVFTAEYLLKNLQTMIELNLFIKEL